MGVNTFESLKFISQTHRELHAKRQQYEWRIIFTVLSLYVLSVAVIVNKETSIPDFHWFNTAVWSVFMLLAIISSIFLCYIHKANARNKSYAEEAEEALVNCLNTKKDIKLEFPKNNFRIRWWAFAWQTTTLLLIATAAAFFITGDW